MKAKWHALKSFSFLRSAWISNPKRDCTSLINFFWNSINKSQSLPWFGSQSCFLNFLFIYYEQQVYILSILTISHWLKCFSMLYRPIDILLRSNNCKLTANFIRTNVDFRSQSLYFVLLYDMNNDYLLLQLELITDQKETTNTTKTN